MYLLCLKDLKGSKMIESDLKGSRQSFGLLDLDWSLDSKIDGGSSDRILDSIFSDLEIH